ncbi:hypothetical protein CASFOL_031631 [Castilleja foliolosa]|uniref:Uncharacterized protein n=1 Tax=Castilleja foliolosa TaxID=1961234 RepID=A0ABD3C643_9LAMI
MELAFSPANLNSKRTLWLGCTATSPTNGNGCGGMQGGMIEGQFGVVRRFV